MTRIKNTTLIDTITLHGWAVTVELDNDNGLYHAVVELPYKEGDPSPHFINACCTYPEGALTKLTDRIFAAQSVMSVLNPWEDKTSEKVHELGIKLMSHKTPAMRAA
jgi:hypothetical protein